MPTLSEFLKEKAVSAADQIEGRRLREEWLASLRRLMDQLMEWLRAADGESILEIYPVTKMAVERKLGFYEVSMLKVILGNKEVKIEPVGRQVLAYSGTYREVGWRADGWVRISDGLTRYDLLRRTVDGDESWHLVAENGKVTPLDQPAFEAVIQELLS